MPFGVNQIKNPTPASLNKNVRIVTIICGILLGWMQTAAFIPSNVQAPISSILGLIIGIINGIAPFFGVEVQEPTVPTDKVASIETETKP